jgi:outer membrane protein OmpA-like peptidoglycan-associated protein
MMNKALLICLVLGYGAFVTSIAAQEKIKLQNPSFEDVPRKGVPGMPSIKGWHDCGLSKFPSESPPDIHPVKNNAWDVALDAYDGDSYLGMVTRANDTYESLSQALSTPIMAGVCYSFSAYLVRSDQYRSATSRTQRLGTDSLENFVRPSVFLIWGGNYFCDKAELLGESPPVSNDDWKKYQFLFQPQKTHKYITIEAFYKTPILEAYNGHVLVDGMSAIEPIDCPLFPQDLIATVSDPPVKSLVSSSESEVHSNTISKSTTRGGGSATVKKGTYSSGKKSFTPRLLTAFDPANLVVGQKIRLDHLYFDPDSVNLSPESYEVLDELAEFLMAYPETVIEIGGHSNTVPPEDYCMWISTERAKSVQEYLISKGVPTSSLKYKGYGKSEPLITYDKYNREARLKNQRVEIMILALP